MGFSRQEYSSGLPLPSPKVIKTCCCSAPQPCLILCDPTDCSMPGFPVPHHLPEFTQVHELVIPSNQLILCHLLVLLPSTFPSIRVFSSESDAYMRKPKYWSFSISTSNEYLGLISFKADWFDLPAVQGTLNLKSSLAPQF